MGQLGILNPGGTVNIDVLVQVLRDTPGLPPKEQQVVLVDWLTPERIEEAKAVGRQRLVIARRRDRTQIYGTPDEETRSEIDEWGCVAEMAVSDYTGLVWNRQLREEMPEKPPDVGESIDAKWTKHPKGHLITHDRDLNERYFVLVCGKPPQMTITGWLQAYETKLPERQNHPKARSPDDYWTPQENLAPTGALKNMIDRGLVR